MTAETRSKNKKGRASEVSPWLAAPALLVFGCFSIIPLVGVVFLSFTQWDGLGDPQWAGTASWGRALSDPTTYNAMWLTLKLVIASWLVQAPISLLLGVFIAGKQRYRAVLGAIFFLPLLLSSAAVGIAYKALLDPNFGMSNAFPIQWLKQNWLGDPNLAFGVVVFVIAWQFIPFHTLIYQAGVRAIPSSLYEAAMIDGAGRVRQFFSITLPQLRYTIVTSTTLILIGALTYFDLVYILTLGGPGTSTRILPLHMYLTGFRSYDMGAASVVSVILVVVGLVMALTLNRLSGFAKMESQQEGVA